MEIISQINKNYNTVTPVEIKMIFCYNINEVIYMEKGKNSFKGTIIAIIAILILVLLSKFAYKEDFEPEVKYYEPTEPTYSFFEGTKLTSAPTEFETY